MIEEFIIDEKTYIKLSATEWRYSAAALGLMKYFDFLAIPIVEKEAELLNDNEMAQELQEQVLTLYEKATGFEYLCFSKELLTEVSYFDFVRRFYAERFPHLLVFEKLRQSTFTDDDIEKINLLINSDYTFRESLSGISFDGKNADDIINVIREKNNDLTKAKYIYKAKKNTNRTQLFFNKKKEIYANFNNYNHLFLDDNKHTMRNCRVLGYYVDPQRKRASVSYGFNENTNSGIDTLLFDWIPFAFVGEGEAFFINANRSLKQLKQRHTFLSSQVQKDKDENKNNNQNVRYSLFNSIIHSAGFINEDVEVIYKNRERDFFETLYIRKESMRIFKSMVKIDYKAFCIPLKINENYYIDVQEKVTNCILNLILTDELIELFLKQKNGNGYLASQFIEINWLIRKGGEMMKKKMSGAYACAKEVVKKIPANKIDSYRQKLTSAIVFKDYDRVCQILLQLSNYSDVSFNFAYDLFEDFENNKDIAYTFINALRNGTDYKTKNEGETQA